MYCYALLLVFQPRNSHIVFFLCCLKCRSAPHKTTGSKRRRTSITMGRYFVSSWRNSDGQTAFSRRAHTKHASTRRTQLTVSTPTGTFRSKHHHIRRSPSDSYIPTNTFSRPSEQALLFSFTTGLHLSWNREALATDSHKRKKLPTIVNTEHNRESVTTLCSFLFVTRISHQQPIPNHHVHQ
jgi:hypothetical protein